MRNQATGREYRTIEKSQTVGSSNKLFPKVCFCTLKMRTMIKIQEHLMTKMAKFSPKGVRQAVTWIQ